MLRSLQSLRGIFALFIFLHHVAGFRAGGDSGVAFFIILSGFVLSRGYTGRIVDGRITTRAFIGRRMARLWPLHLICLAAAIALQLKLFDAEYALIWTLNALMLQSWIPVEKVYFSGNSVSWCLADFLFCYALFPYIVRFIAAGTRQKIAGAAAAVFACYFAAVAALPSSCATPLIYISPLSRIFDFAAGMLLYRLLTESPHDRPDSLSYLTKSVIELSAVALLAAAILLYPFVPAGLAVASFWWIPSLIIIAVFARHDRRGGIVTRILHSPWLVRFGGVSFSFYMVHVLVLQYVRLILNRVGLALPEVCLVVTVFILATVAAVVMSRLLERGSDNSHKSQTKTPIS